MLSVVAIFGGCSSESVAFSEKLRNNKDCYIDVVEIKPDFEDVFIYCRCILADGTEVWMEILDSDYKAYFDANLDEDESSYMPNGVIYDAPVRLNGRAKRVKNVINNSGRRITVFRFGTADIEAAKAENQPAVPFSEGLKEKQPVYVEIESIVAEYTTYNPLDIAKQEYYLCRCNTIDGKEMWLYIFHYYYTNQFLEVYGSLDDPTSTIKLETPIKINGNVYYAESISDDISSKIGVDTVVWFSSVGDNNTAQ